MIIILFCTLHDSISKFRVSLYSILEITDQIKLFLTYKKTKSYYHRYALVKIIKIAIIRGNHNI